MRAEFYVPGRPETAGSKMAFVNPRTGRPIVTESGDANSKARKRSWRSDLRDAAAAALPESWPMEAPMELWLVVIRRRPANHFRSNGEVKDWALDLPPVQRPDLLKHARAAEDALTGVVWRDDALIVAEHLLKSYGDRVGMAPREEGIRIAVRPLALSA